MLGLKKTDIRQLNFYGKYARLIKEFIESDLDAAEVQVDTKPISAVILLREELKMKEITNIKVMLRNNKVYIIKEALNERN